MTSVPASILRRREFAEHGVPVAAPGAMPTHWTPPTDAPRPPRYYAAERAHVLRRIRRDLCGLCPHFRGEHDEAPCALITWTERYCGCVKELTRREQYSRLLYHGAHRNLDCLWNIKGKAHAKD